MVLGYCTTVISLPCLKDMVSNQDVNVGIQSNKWTVFHAPKTWLQARVLMLGYCRTVISFPCNEDLVSSQTFNVGIQSNIWTVFHAPKTRLQARVLMLGYCRTVISFPCNEDLVSSQTFMSVYNQTYEQSSMHQRSGFKPGFWCWATVGQL